MKAFLFLVDMIHLVDEMEDNEFIHFIELLMEYKGYKLVRSEKL